MTGIARQSVENLTNLTTTRQRSVVRGLRNSLGIAALLWMAPAAPATDMQWQPNESIRDTAEQFVLERTGRGKTSVSAGQLDPRHRLPVCDAPLQGFMRRGAKIGARTIVGVRCEGQRPWKVYLPVDVAIADDVYVAARTLPRGHLLSRADIVTAERDVSRLASGYATRPEQLLGQRLRQSVISGRVIAPRMLEANAIVRKGQTVTLLASGGSIAVKMQGEALTDGALGQRIRVENLNSGRIVEGIVRSAEHIEILLPARPDFFPADPKVPVNTADTRVSNNDR